MKRHKLVGEPSQYGTGPMRREWWILDRWTPNRLFIRNGLTNEEAVVRPDELTSLTLRNINKVCVGDAFERVYFGDYG